MNRDQLVGTRWCLSTAVQQLPVHSPLCTRRKTPYISNITSLKRYARQTSQPAPGLHRKWWGIVLSGRWVVVQQGWGVANIQVSSSGNRDTRDAFDPIAIWLNVKAQLAQPRRLNRETIGIVTLSIAALCLFATMVIHTAAGDADSSIASSTIVQTMLKSVSPGLFFGAFVFLAIGFLSFWPVIVAHGREASSTLRTLFGEEEFADAIAAARRKSAGTPSGKRALRLWDQKDPRLNVALFSANVPSFILTADDFFLDWNVAFDMIFGGEPGLRRGVHVATWFELLDNFRNVARRSAKLYGEGILPITDRERVTYISPTYGRMVFTKIMTPLLDQMTGRIVGWSVVLNINSVNKRQEFFEELFARIQTHSRRLRFVSAFHDVVGRSTLFNELKIAHLNALDGCDRVLEVGCGTGELTIAMLRDGKRVTAVDSDTDALRQLKMRSTEAGENLEIVRRSLDSVGELPDGAYDAATMMLGLHRMTDPRATLERVARGVRVGGRIVISSWAPNATATSVLNVVRAELEARGRGDTIKHQFQHVAEFLQQDVETARDRLLSEGEIARVLRGAGFADIRRVRSDLLGGESVFIEARRRGANRKPAV